MKWQAWLGPLVFVVGLGVRLIGSGWGLPNDLHNDSYHPDEPINSVYSQLVDPVHLQLTPPAELKMGQPNFYSYGTLFFTLSHIASAFCPVPEDQSEQAVNAYKRCLLLASRVVSMLAGAGTAWLLFSLLRRRTHVLGATLGGLAVALAPAFVMHSRFATVDVLATFLFACAIYFALRLLPDQEGVAPSHYIRWALLAGLFVGLSAGTKYTGAVGIIGVWVAILAARRPDGMRLIGVSTLATLVAFVVSTPGVIIDAERFRSGLQYEMTHVATGHGLVFVDTPPAAIEHFISLEVGFGLLALLLGLAGIAYAAYKRYPWAIVVLGFLLPYYLLISRGQVKFLRYTFPIYPCLCVGLGWLAGQAHRRMDNKGRVFVALGILGVGLQGAAAAQNTVWMANEDPRDQAGDFFKELAKTNPNLAVGVTDDPWFYTPALYKDVAMPRPQWQREGMARMMAASGPRVVYYRPFVDPGVKPEYVTYSTLWSFDRLRLEQATDLAGDDKAAIDQWKTTQDALKKDYVPFKSFGNGAERVYREDLEYVQPMVEIWKRKDLP